MSRFSLAARITISEANSIPVVRRSSCGSTSRRSARMPQCASLDAGAEEQVEEARQQRVADVAVQPRHRARVDVVHAVADHQVGAVLELGDEARDLVEVVGQVGVGHHDVLAARGREAGEVGAAVAAPRLVDDARAGRRRELARCRPRSRCRRRRPRRGSPLRSSASQRAAHAALDVLRLVEARDHDGDQRRGPRRSRRRARAIVFCGRAHANGDTADAPPATLQRARHGKVARFAARC